MVKRLIEGAGEAAEASEVLLQFLPVHSLGMVEPMYLHHTRALLLLRSSHGRRNARDETPSKGECRRRSYASCPQTPPEAKFGGFVIHRPIAAAGDSPSDEGFLQSQTAANDPTFPTPPPSFKDGGGGRRCGEEDQIRNFLLWASLIAYMGFWARGRPP